MSRFGRQIKTEPKCKICTAAKREEIETWLARSARQEELESGGRVTQDWIVHNSQELFGLRLNRTNLQSHLKKHFEVGNFDLAKQERSDAVVRVSDEIANNGIPSVTPEQLLQDIIGIAWAKAKLDPNSVTLDHGLKAVAEQTKRRQNEAAQQLMEVQGLAIAASFGRRPQVEPPSIPGEAVEVTEAEVVVADATA